ncbi:helix-turn-helix domain-containing protein [Vogesella fluminis]|uniref:helix-turn-helix domain-containing protein n=1 Tax=Vogesella fluminis TaxID=1069161 RepID=UPI00362B9D36
MGSLELDCTNTGGLKQGGIHETVNGLPAGSAGKAWRHGRGKKAEALKMHRNSVNSYKRGERIMDDYACIVVAEYLGIDPLEIIAAANMEREKAKPERTSGRIFAKRSPSWSWAVW